MAKNEIHVTFKVKERSETWLDVEKDTEVTSDPHQSPAPYTVYALHPSQRLACDIYSGTSSAKTFTCPRNWSWY